MHHVSRYSIRSRPTCIQDQQVGHKWVNSQMGGVPWFLAGSIPVGRKANGDPILINPFALNPLGTSVT
jgi:hypothetical protein